MAIHLRENNFEKNFIGNNGVSLKLFKERISILGDDATLLTERRELVVQCTGEVEQHGKKFKATLEERLPDSIGFNSAENALFTNPNLLNTGVPRDIYFNLTSTLKFGVRCLGMDPNTHNLDCMTFLAIEKDGKKIEATFSGFQEFKNICWAAR